MRPLLLSTCPLPPTPYPLLILCLLLLFTGCAPSKAYIDKSAMGQIIWPGPPETPRIKFMWSASKIATTVEGRRGFFEFLAGDVEGDVTDPRTSNVLMRPYSLFVDTKERLYIADPGAYRVTVIDLNTADVINIVEAGKEEFLSPIGVVADPAGRIYISDSELRKVFVFDEAGKFLSEFEGDFLRPTGLAIDPKGSRIYVADTIGHKIHVHTFDGKRIGNLGGPGSLPGEFNFPTHLFVDDKGLLYVTDAMNFRVQVFGPDGKFSGMIGSLGDAHGNLEKPKGVAVDKDGNIYVVDSIKDMVKIFDRQGNLLLFFGNKGMNFGDFWLPAGIFIDTKNMIYVADTYNMRVQAFQFLGGSNDPAKKER